MKTLALLSIMLALPLAAEDSKTERGIPTPEEQSQLALRFIEAQSAEITRLQNLVVALSINPKNQGSDSDKQAVDKASKELRDAVAPLQSKYHAEKCDWVFANKAWSCPETK